MTNDESIIQDVKILQYYKEGKDVRFADIEKVKILANLGLMKMGISVKREKITAKTSALGLKLFRY